MNACVCGMPLSHVVEELGCIQCGRACCLACGVSLESVTYCPACATALMDLPIAHPAGALSVQS